MDRYKQYELKTYLQRQLDDSHHLVRTNKRPPVNCEPVESVDLRLWKFYHEERLPHSDELTAYYVSRSSGHQVHDVL